MVSHRLAQDKIIFDQQNPHGTPRAVWSLPARADVNLNEIRGGFQLAVSLAR
jgi:hypothetical protein